MHYTTNLAEGQQPILDAGPGISPSEKARSLTTFHISLKNQLYSNRVFETNIFRRYVGGELVELKAKDPIKLSEIDPVAQTRAAQSRIAKRNVGEKVDDHLEVVRAKNGKRGKISRYSYRSRRRLQESFARLNKTRLHKPKMLSLTFPRHGRYSDNPIEWKRLLDAFIERDLKAELPGEFFVYWKMEPQERGAPHFHLLIFSDNSKTLRLIYQWRDKWKKAWYELVGSRDPNHKLFGAWVGFGKHRGRQVQNFKSWRGVTCYVSKYLGKTTPDGWEGFKDQEGNSIDYAGRFWGIYNRKFYNSFVQPVDVELSREGARLVKEYVIERAVIDLSEQAGSHLFKMTADERSELPRVQRDIEAGFRNAFDSEIKEATVKVCIPDSYHFRKYITAYKQALGLSARQYDSCGLSCFLEPDAILVGVLTLGDSSVGAVPVNDVDADVDPPPDVEVLIEQLAFSFLAEKPSGIRSELTVASEGV